ncbi:MAG: hypothetical protein V7644_244 [Actinomycetota bacterium]
MRTDLPAGTVTFLFSDVAGSTALLHEHGDDYAELLAAHRLSLRAAFARHGGVEVDTQGDAFFVAFASARAAVAAAGDAQQALAPGPIRVRIGLHTGEAQVTDEGYVGLDVHRAARIAAAGHGGQVLLSRPTRELVDAEVRDLGRHRLKDLLAPERLFQLGDREFPPLKTLRQTNLPVPLTAFVGRERELADVRALLGRDDVRLLTLTGPGGTGKTRLALQAAAEAADAYPDGIWWVALAPLRDPQLVLPTLAQTLGTRNGLTEHLGDRRLLVLLDNFEHLLGAAREVAGLLAACPGLKLLVTSREVLQLGGEHAYPVPPLSPEDGGRLFSARARAALPEYAPTPAAAELCARLDNLPLALELAAARLRLLSTEQLLQRLSSSLDLRGGREADPRQSTLRETIRWSHDLLTAGERLLFAQLAIFAGGCTLEAAEEVCEADLDTLGSLADKSLLRRSGERVWMLETIREYALERLGELGDAEALRERHARYFLGLAERAEPELVGAEQSVWLERIALDHENLRTALERFLATGARASVLTLAGALVVFWWVRGFYQEGLDWLGRAVDSSDEDSAAYAKALWGAAFLSAVGGLPEQSELLGRRALAVARTVGDGSSVARSLNLLGFLSFFRGDGAQARALLEQSAGAARAAGDAWCLADALGTLSSIYPLVGELDSAVTVGEEALELARRQHDLQGIRMALFGLALAAVRRHELETARVLGGEGLAVSREIGDPWFSSYFLWLLGTAALEQGDLAGARVEIEEALAVAREIDAALLLVCALEVLGRIELADGDRTAARRQLREALEISDRGDVPPSYVAAVHFALAALAGASGEPAEARAQLERSADVAHEAGDAWAEARALDALATVDSRDGPGSPQAR